MRVFSLFILVFAVLCASCKKEAQLPYNKLDKEDSTAIKVEQLNAYLHANEDSLLALRADSLGLKPTPWGIYVQIFHIGNGDSVRDGDEVNLEYILSDMQGDTLRNKIGSNREKYLVGKDRHQKGLSYALQMMRIGDSAWVLSPSVLSYGALGDRKNIPPRASLMYRIKSVSNR